MAALAVMIAATGSSSASSINDQLTDSQVSTFCANQPVGADIAAAATIAGGTFVSGTVNCETADVAAASTNNLPPAGTGGYSRDTDDDNSWSGGGDDSHGDDSDDDHGGDNHGGQHDKDREGHHD